MKEKIVFVVNISLDKMGSLTIFHQFMDAMKLQQDNIKYYIFCRLDEMLKFHSENIIIEILNLSRIDRFRFESCYLLEWSKRNKVKADLIISLQNTSIKYFDNIPQIILFQQSIPLSDYHWNIFVKNERQMFFYKYIYPIFVRRYIKSNTTIVTPTHWVKNAIVKKWNINPGQIQVIYSQLRTIEPNKIKVINLDHSLYHMFYPANAAPHKNHGIILLAIYNLKKINSELFRKIILHLTFNKTDSEAISKLVDQLGLNDAVSFEGRIDFENVLSFYKESDLLLYPSFIESFGLPLIEAASFGIPIIASNLPYSREVVSEYPGVVYVNYNCPEDWAYAINEQYNKKSRYPGYSVSFESGWANFMNLIQEKLN
jgi:glycosyltransferase involved in cell wall biosynthesis